MPPAGRGRRGRSPARSPRSRGSQVALPLCARGRAVTGLHSGACEGDPKPPVVSPRLTSPSELWESGLAQLPASQAQSHHQVFIKRPLCAKGAPERWDRVAPSPPLSAADAGSREQVVGPPTPHPRTVGVGLRRRNDSLCPAAPQRGRGRAGKPHTPQIHPRMCTHVHRRASPRACMRTHSGFLEQLS